MCVGVSVFTCMKYINTQYIYTCLLYTSQLLCVNKCPCYQLFFLTLCFSYTFLNTSALCSLSMKSMKILNSLLQKQNRFLASHRNGPYLRATRDHKTFYKTCLSSSLLLLEVGSLFFLCKATFACIILD